MSPQRKTALVSVIAAAGLVAVKLATGLATHSLGLVSEAAHSGTDLVAALLTFFTVGVASRPADPGHNYGHLKAEHLGALAEAAILVLASLFIAWRAILRLTGQSSTQVDATWYALLVVVVVMAVDIFRMTVSRRVGRRYGSPAIQANALHFGTDLIGSGAVLVGLLLARAGHPNGDPVAALLVAVLVLIAAGRLMRRNVDVLMDRAPADAREAAQEAIDALEPRVEVLRLRMRQAAGRYFADVVIAVPATAAVGQGHATADAVEAAVQRALPEADVVVHVEPRSDEAAVRERATAAALRVPGVREIHNLNVVSVDGLTDVSLHLKLPGELPLEQAHEVATQVERAIEEELPEVDTVQTHLEPLAEEAAGHRPEAEAVAGAREAIQRAVGDLTGGPLRDLRFLDTSDGLVAYLTVGLDPRVPLAGAHATASEIEQRIRAERPEIADVIVHTEP